MFLFSCNLLNVLVLGFAMSTNSSDPNFCKSVASHVLPKHPAVDAQVEAYRKRDLHAFLEPYADQVTVRIVNNPDLTIHTKVELAARYKVLFEASPKLSLNILSRHIQGDWVEDVEEIQYLRGDSNVLKFQVRYRISNEKIVEVEIRRL
jgi:hypothetical protein